MSGYIQLMIGILIITLSGTASRICPPPCHCTQTVINCRKANLTEIPNFVSDIEGRFKVLLLDYNKIRKLSTDSFINLPGLEVINLKSNLISDFSGNVFCDLLNLTELNLDQNQFFVLPPAAFQGCGSLQVLTLNGNFICDFSKIGPSISHLTKLRKLGLSGNVMDDFCGSSHPILPAEISKLKLLNELDLSDNMYRHLQRKHLENLADLPLKRLDLSRTFLNQVDNDTFIDLRRLENLDLSYQTSGVPWIKKALHSLVNSSLHSLKLRNVFVDGDEDSKFSHNHLKPLHRLKLEFLDLGESFGAWPKHLPGRFFRDVPHLVELFLDGSELFSIVPGAFSGLVNLKRLHLQNNMISCGGVNTFLYTSPPLPRLQYLDLNNNVLMTSLSIFKVSKESFPNLRTLLLRNNRIASVSRDTFMTDTLEMLDLSENPLKLLPNGTFSLLSSLQKLNLEEMTHLQEIEGDSFQGLLNLKELKMNNNFLKIVHPHAFAHLKNLTNLHLSDCSLFSSQDVDFMHAFDSLDLSYLDLSGNRLEKVPSFISKQSNIKHINMSYNRIQRLTKGQLPPKSNILLINVSYNDIVELNSDITESLRNVKDIDISGNPFYCSCGTFYKTIFRNVNVINSNRTICKAPKENAGIQIINFNPSSWNCQIKNIVVPILMVSVMLAVIVLYIIIRKCQKAKRTHRQPLDDHNVDVELLDRNGHMASMRNGSGYDDPHTKLIAHSDQPV